MFFVLLEVDIMKLSKSFRELNFLKLKFRFSKLSIIKNLSILYVINKHYNVLENITTAHSRAQSVDFKKVCLHPF